MGGNFAEPRTSKTQACMQHRIVRGLLKRNVDANLGDLEKQIIPNSSFFQDIIHNFVNLCVLWLILQKNREL